MESYWKIFKEKKFEELKENIKVDVCIIGGGLTGLTTGYLLSKQGKKVVILERDEICSHTSSGTTGKVTSQHGLFYDYLIESKGKEFAKEYFDANEQAISNIRQIIEEEQIECDFKVLPAFVFTQKDDDVKKIKQEVDATRKIGIDSKFVDNIELPMEILGAIEFHNQAQFHPIKYANGLVNSILKNGGEIFEHTKVIDVEKIEEGNIVKANGCEVTAENVVVATRYPIISVPGYYFLKMYQSSSFAVLADPHEELKFRGMYINTEQPQLSFRMVEEKDKKLLLAVGYDYKTGEEFVGNPYEFLESKIKNMYPNAEILYKWRAEDCISLDKIPYIGEFSILMPKVFVATGFNKWGMTSSNIAANIITDKIIGKENPYEEIFKSVRLEPVKNKDELTNMIKETAKSFVGKRLQGEDTPTCTHLGCKTHWNDLDKTWDCPCHGSRFNKEGNVIEGPAVQNLKEKEL